jgi:hypothetical protein
VVVTSHAPSVNMLIAATPSLFVFVAGYNDGQKRKSHEGHILAMGKKNT